LDVDGVSSSATNKNLAIDEDGAVTAVTPVEVRYFCAAEMYHFPSYALDF